MSDRAELGFDGSILNFHGGKQESNIARRLRLRVVFISECLMGEEVSGKVHVGRIRIVASRADPGIICKPR